MGASTVDASIGTSSGARSGARNGEGEEEILVVDSPLVDLEQAYPTNYLRNRPRRARNVTNKKERRM